MCFLMENHSWKRFPRKARWSHQQRPTYLTDHRIAGETSFPLA